MEKKCSNETDQSTTQSDSRLFRKGLGKKAKLNHTDRIVMGNLPGFIVKTELTPSGMRQEPLAELGMLKRKSRSPRQTVGGEKGYDTGYE